MYTNLGYKFPVLVEDYCGDITSHTHTHTHTHTHRPLTFAFFWG